MSSASMDDVSTLHGCGTYSLANVSRSKLYHASKVHLYREAKEKRCERLETARVLSFPRGPHALLHLSPIARTLLLPNLHTVVVGLIYPFRCSAHDQKLLFFFFSFETEATHLGL